MWVISLANRVIQLTNPTAAMKKRKTLERFFCMKPAVPVFPAKIIFADQPIEIITAKCCKKIPAHIHND